MKATIEKILVPTDFSKPAQQAFRHALYLADLWNAEIHLLHAVYPEYTTTDIPVMSAKATRDKLQFAESALKSFIDIGITQLQVNYSLKNLPSIKSVVELGSPVGTINRKATEFEVDLIIMGTKGEHNTLEKTFGSVTTGVIEGAPCSVWIVPEDAPLREIRQAVYAAELTESDPFYFWEATRLLKPQSPELHILHVKNGAPSATDISMDDLKSVFMDQAPDTNIRFEERQSHQVIEELESYIDDEQIDLLIMFAPPHSILNRLVHRSKTKRMAMETHVPLLLIKRDK